MDERRLAHLKAELERGPAAHGYTEDQRWTLARVADLIASLFRIRSTTAPSTSPPSLPD